MAEGKVTNPGDAEKKPVEQESLFKDTAENVAADLAGKTPAAVNADVKKDGAEKPAPATAEKNKPAPVKVGEAAKTAPAAEKGGTPPKDKKVEQKPKTDKAKTAQAKKPREPRMPGETKTKGAAVVGGGAGKVDKAAEVKPEPPPPPRDATRPGPEETIVYIDHAELHPFKNHPFKVRDDEAMKTLIASVKERGVDQPALVRPREGGGYELVAGHRRQHASELAGIKNIPCIVRNMTDEEATLAMAESNFNQRSEILASERAQALKMQLDAIKRQGERFKGVASGDVGKRSVEIVAERNGMNYKTVQRYIALNKLTPELMKFVDDGKVKFIPAVELSFIKPKNQQYIATSLDSAATPPSGDQAKRMRELDQKGTLNYDVIDGIMLEEKRKGDIQVILSGQELEKYFGPEKTPAEMKETILKALDDYKARQPLEFDKPPKTKEKEK